MSDSSHRAGQRPGDLTPGRMHNRYLTIVCFLVVAGGFAGCTSQTKTAEKDDPNVVVEAPLGSRIKKKSNAAPLTGATREDIENARVSQGARQTGEFVRTGN